MGQPDRPDTVLWNFSDQVGSVHVATRDDLGGLSTNGLMHMKLAGLDE
jgi:hypothetical protein